MSYPVESDGFIVWLDLYDHDSVPDADPIYSESISVTYENYCESTTIEANQNHEVELIIGDTDETNEKLYQINH